MPGVVYVIGNAASSAKRSRIHLAESPRPFHQTSTRSKNQERPDSNPVSSPNLLQKGEARCEQFFFAFITTIIFYKIPLTPCATKAV